MQLVEKEIKSPFLEEVLTLTQKLLDPTDLKN